MEKHVLSKSTYIKGVQCLKALYLYKNRYFLRDRMPPERVATFTRGTRVGLFAQKLFPDGVDCGAKSPRAYAKAIEKTALAIKSGETIIYEAGFIKHNTLVFLDILVKKENGWHAYEVKSSLKLSPTYYQDAALQNYVIKESGLELKSFNLIHINPDYIFNDSLDIFSLFKIVDVSEECESKYGDIGVEIRTQIEMLKEKHSPKIEIGTHCRSPYDCDFIGHCWKHIPKKSIFNLPSIDFETKMKLYNKHGANLVEDYENVDLPNIQKNQLNSIINNSIRINHQTINDLKTISGKKALLKIFTFKPAIPLFNNTKPYQNQAFGFGAVLIDENGNKTDTKLFFAKNSNNVQDEVLTEISSYLIDYKQIILFHENSYPKQLLGTKTVHNLYNLFVEGAIIHPEITALKFNNIYKALIGKIPWFKKILIDQQAALIYEKSYRNNFEDEEAMEQINTYALEYIKYFERLYSTIINLK